LHSSSLLPLDGCGGEGRSSGEEMQESEPQQHWDAMKLSLRGIPSVGDFRLRFLWPRGPRRTWVVSAPGNINFLHALGLWWKICNLSSVIHPVDEPSGVVPGVVDGDSVAVEKKDLIAFLISFLRSFL
jgi:hypothetical protein